SDVSGFPPSWERRIDSSGRGWVDPLHAMTQFSHSGIPWRRPFNGGRIRIMSSSVYPGSGMMIDAFTFDARIRRVRAGAQDAATELVGRSEPAIRRAVRFRLADARLGTLLDSMDICQSVLASFFIRAASGQYELQNSGQLLRLLTAMARNKL